MTRATYLLAAAFAVAATASGCLGSDSSRVGAEPTTETRELTMLDPFSNRQVLTEFAGEVERLSDGAMRIRIVEPGHHGPDFEAATIRDMRGGRADLAFAGSRAWDEFGVESMRALSAPLLIDSYRLQERVLASELVNPMLEELRPLGLVGIGILPGPIRRLLGAEQPLTAPGDFRGLTIGTQQSSVADATLRALGAEPRRYPATVGSLDGVEGIEHSVQAIEAAGLDVDGSHLMTNINLWPRPLVLFANLRSYRDLTADQRGILRRAAANAVPERTTVERALELESSGNLCRKGQATFDTASPSELRKMRRAIEPVYSDLEGDAGTRAAIDAVERLKRETQAPPAEVPKCGRADVQTSNGASAIDGVWRMDTDPSAAGSEGLEENWGRWVYVFDRGRFAVTQENQDACTWQYGRFEVDGNRMSWTFTDGGGIAPNDAHNKPGEFFVFDFSAYRDTLTVRPVEGEISPLNFRAKPWRRVSDTPSRRYFSKRCPPPAAALRDR
jgi:TRAP-type C4-dicarboxylate transport system substrate-binding protein